ncbi:Exodeoxyribonuclease 7 small subunit [Alphaproteobacteria bacterium SO-S41]|nr:Exodeoxyribonuclease 7 small subunit [Alphaproteobacteria bacterium SO-S41]
MAKTDLGALSFEEALKQLEEIVGRLESGRVELEESITIYERGAALKAHCERKLKDAEARIEKIVLGPGGAPAGTEKLDAG